MFEIAQEMRITQAKNAYNEYVWLRKLMKETFVNEFTDMETFNEKVGYTTTSVIQYIMNELNINFEDSDSFDHIMDCIYDEDSFDFMYQSLINSMED